MARIKTRRMIAFFTAMIILISFIPFSDGTNVNAAKPRLNKKSATLNIGDSIKLKVKNNKKKVRWSTSDEDVAKVSSSGNVTALRPGSTTITAKVKNKKYKCSIEVRKPLISLNASNVNMNVGSTKILYASVLNYDGAVVWESSNDSIATVALGKVTAHRSGTVTIRASIPGGAWAKCTVTVTNDSPNATTENQTNDSPNATTENQTNYGVQFIANRSVYYDETIKSYILRFSLLKSDKMTMTYGAGVANVSIVNELSDVVYTNSIAFDESSFKKVDTEAGKKLMCCLSIPRNQIIVGDSAKGTIIFSVKGNCFSFDESSVIISGLPVLNAATTEITTQAVTTTQQATTQVATTTQVSTTQATTTTQPATTTQAIVTTQTATTTQTPATTETVLSPQEMYDKNFDDIVKKVKQNGDFSKYGGYCTYGYVSVSMSGDTIEIYEGHNREGHRVVIKKGSTKAIARVNLSLGGYATAEFDIATFKGDTSDQLNWSNNPSQGDQFTYDAAIANVFKNVQK